MEGWRVTPPFFRVDVTREVDLVEEVARHFGYDQLPARLRPAPPRIERDIAREKDLTLSAKLVGLGYREIIPPSMVDPAENARFTDRPPVILANPLSQEASVLRSTAIPSMVRALRWNLDRGQDELRFFELGKTYSPRAQGLPEERRVLTLGLCGHRRPPSVHDKPEEREKELGFFDLKGDLETLLEVFEVRDLQFQPDGARHHYEPGLSGRFVAGGRTLAVFGELSRELAREYKFRQAVWLAEVDIEGLAGTPFKTHTFVPFSKFPVIERDFSVVVPEQVPYRQLEEAVLGLGLEAVQSLRPVDVFRGGSIASGHYSLLLRVTFQSLTRTLTSEEIAEASQQLLAALAALGVHLRT
jgi:phenylalanyl-tRNA synthetase beta chain